MMGSMMQFSSQPDGKSSLDVELFVAQGHVCHWKNVPSPFTLMPSSHCSPISKLPSPQNFFTTIVASRFVQGATKKMISSLEGFWVSMTTCVSPAPRKGTSVYSSSSPLLAKGSTGLALCTQDKPLGLGRGETTIAETRQHRRPTYGLSLKSPTVMRPPFALNPSSKLPAPDVIRTPFTSYTEEKCEYKQNPKGVTPARKGLPRGRTDRAGN